VHCESRAAIAVEWGQFGNSGRKTSTVGSRYQRTGVEQHTKKTQCEYSELQRDCEIVTVQTVNYKKKLLNGVSNKSSNNCNPMSISHTTSR
jgi:hypothetical protein